MNFFKKLIMTRGIPYNKYNPHAWIIGNPEIAEGVWIGAFSVIDGSGGLKIGKDTTVSCGAHIYTHSAVNRNISEKEYSQIDRRPVEIGECVHIGPNVIILMGSKVGHHSIIGAGAVVLEGSDIPPYSVVAGVPAKVIKKVSRDIVPKRLLEDYQRYVE